MKLTSSAFNDNEIIPSKYTCDGANISPPLAISEVPAGTKGLVLITDDPDAPTGTFVHWVMYNIPAGTAEIKENIPDKKILVDGSVQGVNGFGRIGYGGPCPPSGTHRYFFKVYALDKELEETAGRSKSYIEKAIKGHIIAKGELLGLYKRK